MIILRKLLSLAFGIVLVSIGIVLMVQSQTGVSPWDVFHTGLSNVTGISIGEASQIVGIFLVILAVFIKEYPGWGTIFNTYFIGLFIDLLLESGYVPLADIFWQQWLMLLTGIFIFGWGTCFYLTAELGSGPRDSVMMGLIKRYKQPVWKIRMLLELTALVMGFFMGGMMGIGTIVFAILVGPSVQFAFKIRGKKANDIEHRTIINEYHMIKEKVSQS